MTVVNHFHDCIPNARVWKSCGDFKILFCSISAMFGADFHSPTSPLRRMAGGRRMDFVFMAHTRGECITPKKLIAECREGQHHTVLSEDDLPDYLYL